jgi:hypothetical protein
MQGRFSVPFLPWPGVLVPQLRSRQYPALLAQTGICQLQTWAGLNEPASGGPLLIDNRQPTRRSET